jgi:hypothetical protein
MSALDRLVGLLRSNTEARARPFAIDTSIDRVIVELKRYGTVGTLAPLTEDLQQRAVRRFWDSPRFETLRDARLVSFGMCVPSKPAGPCIMEDRERFLAVLDSRDGVDQWVDQPRWYRRCYQGLVRSYFTYDALVDSAPSVGRQNWLHLREYLNARTLKILDHTFNPDWVRTAVANRQLFSDAPCASYAAAVLHGDTSTIEQLCEQLGVIEASWFRRELVIAQIRQATSLNHEGFKERIPTLVRLLQDNHVLRDRGLILILNEYASVTQPPIEETLRNAAVEWWGNPWLPSNETRWGGVLPKAREMVAEWLKREFIEAFFTKLAEDGVGDRRRANFWLRYAKSMENVQFALGKKALYSKDRDFVALRQKMKGLYTELKSTDSANNAFVMTFGSVVVVEFGGVGNALYGYDRQRALPFDLSKPVLVEKNGRNSLKHEERILWLGHNDGVHGYRTWEELFTARLKQGFGVHAKAVSQPPPTYVPVIPPQRQVVPHPQFGEFSVASLIAFARARNLPVDDRRRMNGNLWVRTDTSDLEINKTLQDWNFSYRPGKGWWR